MNEETANKAIVKFCQSKFENHILIKSFSRLSRDTFITMNKAYDCKQNIEEEHSDNYNAFSIDRFSSKNKTWRDSSYINKPLL